MCVCFIVFHYVCVSVSLGGYFPVSRVVWCVCVFSFTLPPFDTSEIDPMGSPSRVRLGQGQGPLAGEGELSPFLAVLGAGPVTPQQCSVSLSSQHQIPGFGWWEVARGPSASLAPPLSLAQGEMEVG